MILFGMDTALYIRSGQSIQCDSTAGPIVVVNYFESLEKKFKGCIAISANDEMSIFTNIRRESIRCAGLDKKDRLLVYFTDDRGDHFRVDAYELANTGFAPTEALDEKSFLEGEVILTLSKYEIDTIHRRGADFPIKFKKIGG